MCIRDRILTLGLASKNYHYQSILSVFLFKTVLDRLERVIDKSETCSKINCRLFYVIFVVTQINNQVVQNSHLILFQDDRFCTWLSSVVGGVVLGFIHLSHNNYCKAHWQKCNNNLFDFFLLLINQNKTPISVRHWKV